MTQPDHRLAAARPDLADERLRGRVAVARFAPGLARTMIAPSGPLRRRPAPDAPLDTEALMGERVRVFDERDGYAWAQLESDGYVGYLPGSVLGADAPAPTHRVRVLRTFVYPGPDLKLPPSSFLSFGAGVTPSGDPRSGYVPLSTGGFAFADHLAPAAAREADVAGTAERFLGAPYLWGGKTSLGLDCSGLVQLALAAAGIAAPRDSDQQQAALGHPVSEAELRRGDLVFWRGHVGIMLDPERLLHANAHHMVVAIEPLQAACSRILTATGQDIAGARRLALPSPS